MPRRKTLELKAGGWWRLSARAQVRCRLLEGEERRGKKHGESGLSYHEAHLGLGGGGAVSCLTDKSPLCGGLPGNSEAHILFHSHGSETELALQNSLGNSPSALASGGGGGGGISSISWARPSLRRYETLALSEEGRLWA